ncbi:MAG: hypothetical protein V3R80_01485 [Candidatus Tectomicrobia bacterium]
MTRVIVLDPREETAPVATALAPRLTSLDGKVVGLFSNRKANARELLHQVVELVGARYKLAGVVYIEKETHRRVAAPAILNELAQRCDVVIAASAD